MQGCGARREFGLACQLVLPSFVSADCLYLGHKTRPITNGIFAIKSGNSCNYSLVSVIHAQGTTTDKDENVIVV